MRKASSSGCTFKGRRRDFSSAQRTAGITPVARHARSSVTSPFFRHWRAIVFGRSKTHCKGAPPQLARCSAKVRTKLSTASSGTRLTHMKREYFRREAKKWMRWLAPIDELHFDLSKIMLTELPGQTFETNQRLGRLRAERGHQRVEGSLASLIACFPNSPQNLQRR